MFSSARRRDACYFTNTIILLGILTSLTRALQHLQGDILEEVHDVELNNNASFYRAILAVHKENYGLAMSLIHETREQLSGMCRALLSTASPCVLYVLFCL
jgi:hypothetical protein